MMYYKGGGVGGLGGGGGGWGGDFVRGGGGLCPSCKIQRGGGDYVLVVKFSEGDYVLVVKFMGGILSTYTKMSRGFLSGGDYVRIPEFGPVVQKEMLFEGISYLEVWQPFCSADRSNSCYFDRRQQFCEINLNLDQWFRRKCRLKVFLIWSSGSPVVQ